ncbi:hypothetical protein M407DRAFT_71663, partial [Tulasnella calospora MUT 4182]
EEPPDMSNYVDIQTLDSAKLDLNNPHRRIIMVGDLHGMLHSFEFVFSTWRGLANLLDVLKYNSTNDLVIHLGDISAKGPHSNELVARFAKEGVLGVRGNNDQKVIEWYAWFEWVKSHENGDLFLHALFGQRITPSQAKSLKLWKSLKYSYPKDWDWGGDHWNIARNLSPEDYQYLSSLPIVIHLPSLHTFMVHAGLLPMDPAHHLRSDVQPLAHVPESLPENPTAEDIERARYVQELSLLTDIAPNRDPYVKLNIRDIHDLEPTKRGPEDHEDNVPWSDLWNSVIKRCRGFNSTSDVSELRLRKPLPCNPITVVYSHASSRGLDLKKWSKGLDTGCVNGDGLTAMILGKGRHKALPPRKSGQKVQESAWPNDNDDERDKEVPFGENMRARLVSVSCPTPPHRAVKKSE